MMDLQLIRSFVEVAQSGSFAGASERLFVTQSAVSLRIQRLEDQLGRSLFERSSEGVQLTSAGQAFTDFAHSMLETWEQACQRLRGNQGEGAPLRVGVECGLYHWPVLPWLGAMAHLPQAPRIELETGLSRDLQAGLAAGRLDLVFCSDASHRPSIVAQPMPHETIILLSNVAGARRGQMPSRYILADWGADFMAFHASLWPKYHQEADIRLPGPQAEAVLLGGADAAAYLPSRIAAPYLASGQMFAVSEAPSFSRSIWMMRSEGADLQRLTVALKALNDLQLLPETRLMQLATP